MNENTDIKKLACDLFNIIKALCGDKINGEEIYNFCDFHKEIYNISEKNTLNANFSKLIVEACSAYIDETDLKKDETIMTDPEKSANYFRNFLQTAKFRGATVKKGNVYGTYIILKGSRLSPRQSEKCAESIKKLFEDLVNKGAINAETGEVLCDITVNSATAASSLILGHNSNGKQCLDSNILWD